MPLDLNKVKRGDAIIVRCDARVYRGEFADAVYWLKVKEDLHMVRVVGERGLRCVGDRDLFVKGIAADAPPIADDAASDTAPDAASDTAPDAAAVAPPIADDADSATDAPPDAASTATADATPDAASKATADASTDAADAPSEVVEGQLGYAATGQPGAPRPGSSGSSATGQPGAPQFGYAATGQPGAPRPGSSATGQPGAPQLSRSQRKRQRRTKAKSIALSYRGV